MRTPVKFFLAAGAVGVVGVLAACTVHPRGEADERAAVMRAAAPYARPVEARVVPELSAGATPNELVTYALLTNAALEQKYWEWRAALEQVPQEGTQKTSPMISLGSMITNGSSAASMTTLGLGNDPMNNLVLPGKLETAARVALEEARAAGRRFDATRVELRSKVLAAYADYALAAELARLEDANAELLGMAAKVIESRIGTGGATQQDLLRASNDLEVARSESAVQRARLPAQRAALNALLNRPADAPLQAPAALPDTPPLAADDATLLAQAAARNPELEALAREIAAKHESIIRARQDYLPEFGVNVSTDLAGVTQSLMGSVMLPVLRHEAIDAQVRQARANLHAAEAMHVQARRDLASRVVADLALLRDLDRQITLYEQTVLPRAQRVVAAIQSGYAVGQSSLLDLLDAQRSLVSLRRMVAEFRVSRYKQAADLDAATAGGATAALSAADAPAPRPDAPSR
jgi:outer membrane protein TolC